MCITIEAENTALDKLIMQVCFLKLYSEAYYNLTDIYEIEAMKRSHRQLI